MVLTMPWGRIHLENLTNRLASLDFLANQPRLVLNAAKSRHDEQLYPDLICRLDHALPLFCGLGRQPLHTANEVGAYLN